MKTARLQRATARGHVLLVVLVALMLAAAAAADYGQRRAHERQRDDEAELLYVGEQYRQAIESYWRQSPGGVKQLPTRMSDLVQDPRFPQARRHLRKLYADPLAPASEWGLVRQGQAIVGVYSQAPGTPFRTSGFSEAQAGFENATHYADWRFVARLAVSPSSPSSPASQAKP